MNRQMVIQLHMNGAVTRVLVPGSAMMQVTVAGSSLDVGTGEISLVEVPLGLSWYEFVAPPPGLHLMDARSLQKQDEDGRKVPLIRLLQDDGVCTVFGPSCAIPSDRPFWCIIEEIMVHQDEFPTHGPACICMDNYAREIRAHLFRSVPSEEWNNSTEWADNFQRRERVHYVLSMVLRSL
jgi:hypothetical protein